MLGERGDKRPWLEWFRGVIVKLNWRKFGIGCIFVSLLYNIYYWRFNYFQLILIIINKCILEFCWNPNIVYCTAEVLKLWYVEGFLANFFLATSSFLPKFFWYKLCIFFFKFYPLSTQLSGTQKEKFENLCYTTYIISNLVLVFNVHIICCCRSFYRVVIINENLDDFVNHS